MRGPLLAIALAGLVAGCTAPARPDESSEGASSLDFEGPLPFPLCPPTVFADSQSTVTGGGGEGSFELPRACTLVLAFQVQRQVGRLAVRLEGPAEPVLEYDTTALVVPGVNVVAGGTQRANGGTQPAGTYHYRWEAEQVAEFDLAVATG